MYKILKNLFLNVVALFKINQRISAADADIYFDEIKVCVNCKANATLDCEHF